MSIRNGKIPLIPDIAGITKAVCETFAKDKKLHPIFELLQRNFITDSVSDPNIEFILSHIRSLMVVAGKDTVRGLSLEQLKEIDAAICAEIEQIVDKLHLDEKSPYHHLANWINSIPREHPISVFTTNYDLLIEQAFETTRTPFFDGFSGSRNAFFDLQAVEEDVIPNRWVRLWKLHGSINWFQSANGKISRSSFPPPNSVSRLIHPSHLKYDESRRMPFLVMIDRLRALLKQPTSLLVLSGYSFGDEHLNEVIIQGLQANPSSMAFALLYGDLENYEMAVSLASTQTNLTLLAFDKGVVGGIPAHWAEIEEGGQLPLSEKWLKNVSKDDESTKTARTELHLGDFAVFGEFLKVISGIREKISNEEEDE